MKTIDLPVEMVVLRIAQINNADYAAFRIDGNCGCLAGTSL